MSVWIDGLLDKAVEDDDIARLVAAHFGVDPSAVLVIPDVSTIETVLPVTTTVVIEKRPRRGDFASQVGFILRTDALDVMAEETDPVAFWAGICKELGARCWTADDSLVSTSGFLIEPDGTVTRTFLDEDEEEEGRVTLREAVEEPIL